MPKMSEVDGHC